MPIPAPYTAVDRTLSAAFTKLTIAVDSGVLYESIMASMGCITAAVA